MKLFKSYFLIPILFVFLIYCGDKSLINTSGCVGPQTEILKFEMYKKLIYISTSGSDKQGDGSKENPWKTITFALAQINDNAAENRYAICVAAGERWGVIKSNTAQSIEVWGDLNDVVSFTILPTFQLQ